MQQAVLKIMLSSLIVGGVLHAKPITEEEAKNVALNFLYKKSGGSLQVKELFKSDTFLKKVQSTSKQTTSNPTIRLIKLEPQGWVLVSGDDVAKPIIGYSLESEFDENNLPPQLEWMLETFSKQISDARAKTKISIPLETSLKWEELKINPFDFKDKNTFNPFTVLSTRSRSVKSTRASATWKLEKERTLRTPRWGQKAYYNNLTPQDMRGVLGHVPTGCVATAMAEIMRYHRWPTKLFNTPISYTDGDGSTPNSVPTSYYNSPTYLNHTYQWSSMPMNSLTSHNLDVAILMHHAGVAIQTDYGYEVSGASPEMAAFAFSYYFNYHIPYEGTPQRKENFLPKQWKTKIYTDLRQGYPILYSSEGSGAHTFVIEGFDVEGSEFEINFGWDGQSNGYWTLDDITPDDKKYTENHIAIFGIKPNNLGHHDSYEKDNSWRESSYMIVSERQANHSIYPSGDDDWVTFWNNSYRNITIETLPNRNTTNGYNDTELKLYDYRGRLIASNDDGGQGYFSKIQRTLSSGRYFIKVIGFDDEEKVSSYDLSIR